MSDLARLGKIERVLGSELPRVPLSELDWEHLGCAFSDERLVGLSIGKFDLDLNLLSDLVNLERLFLYKCQISDLSPLKPLTSLTYLDVSYNKISDLSPLKPFTALTSLDVSNNKISDLSPLKPLTSLISLEMSDNQISDLIPLKPLTSLTQLHLYDNKIRDLGPLKPLTALISLDLRHNAISLLPPWLFDLQIPIDLDDNGRNIALSSNPLQYPPPEIIRAGKDAVSVYYEAEGEPKNLNEIKLVLIGDGSAGKTSLVNRLLGFDFNPTENTTHGIRIQPWTFANQDGEGVKVNIWDFGGQEIMHATHQFFLSERCVYIVVLDSRKDQRAEYWLKHAANFGGDAPVLVVLNKIDQHPGFDVNRKFLNENYPAIVDYFKVSCRTDEGMGGLKAKLQQQLSDQNLCQILWPGSWLKVKESLEKSPAPYMDQAAYQELCRRHAISDLRAQSTLVKLLHDLGVAIRFDDLRLRDTYVLNPLWVTLGVYTVITAKEPAQRQGILLDDDMPNIFQRMDQDEGRHDRFPNLNQLLPTFTKGLVQHPDRQNLFPENLHGYLIELMEKFELAYRLKRGKYLIPDLLAEQEPVFEILKENVRHFRLIYEFLPPSVIPRFMVKRHHDIRHQWRSGMVLNHLESKTWAVVREHMENRRILITLTGPMTNIYMHILRDTLAQIHQGFHTEIREEIACPCDGCRGNEKPEFWDLGKVMKLILHGHRDMPCSNSGDFVGLPAILGGVFETSTRDRFMTAIDQLESLGTKEEIKDWFDHFSDVVSLKFGVGGVKVDFNAMFRKMIDKSRK